MAELVGFNNFYSKERLKNVMADRTVHGEGFLMSHYNKQTQRLLYRGGCHDPHFTKEKPRHGGMEKICRARQRTQVSFFLAQLLILDIVCFL